jgi:hypothetical protein
MSAPYEIIAAPLEVYVAPVGEAFPAVDASPPGGNWTLVGTLGSREYAEDGVTITHEETVEDFRGLGSTGILKSFRTEEGHMLSFSLVDLTLEQYRQRLNFNVVSQVAASAGVAGYRSVALYKGLEVVERALLIRGVSPYGDGMKNQYEFPRARPEGSTELTFQKGEPAMLNMEWVLLEDINASSDEFRFGRIVSQDALAT